MKMTLHPAPVLVGVCERRGAFTIVSRLDEFGERAETFSFEGWLFDVALDRRTYGSRLSVPSER